MLLLRGESEGWAKCLILLGWLLGHGLLEVFLARLLIGPSLPLVGESVVRMAIVAGFSLLLGLILVLKPAPPKQWLMFLVQVLGMHGLRIYAFSLTQLWVFQSRIGTLELLLSLGLIALGFLPKPLVPVLKRAGIAIGLFGLSFGALWLHGFVSPWAEDLKEANAVSSPCPEGDCFADFYPGPGGLVVTWLRTGWVVGVRLNRQDPNGPVLELRWLGQQDGQNIRCDRSQKLTPAQANRIMLKLEKSGFWTVDQKNLGDGLDGQTCFFLANDGIREHRLRVWEPALPAKTQADKTTRIPLLKLALELMERADVRVAKRKLM